MTGLPHNVESARREIEQHIYQRTGNMPMTDPSASIQNYEMAALASNVSRVNGGGYSTQLSQQQQSQQQQTMRQISGYGNEYCGVENLYRTSGLRSGGNCGMGMKAYSASGSPPPFYGDMMPSQQPTATGMGSNVRQMVNNENIYNPQSWQPQQQQNNCNSRMMFNESSLFNDFLPNPRANSFGSTNNYLSNNNTTSSIASAATSTTLNYLSSLSSSSHSRDEGLGDSPSST